jgi:hypothetical protein
MSFFLENRNKLASKGPFLTIIDIFRNQESIELMDVETSIFGGLGQK